MRGALLMAFHLSAVASCTSDSDCSLNGVCNVTSGTCACDAAWLGARCQTLHLLPAERSSGLRLRGSTDASAAPSAITTQAPVLRNISTWGGAVQYSEEDGLWHMWASQMVGFCGIQSWSTNSQLVHATSDTPTGTYSLAPSVASMEINGSRPSGINNSVVFPRFAHEADVTRGPNGEWVMYFVMNKAPDAAEECNTTTGVSVAQIPAGERRYGGMLRYRGDQPTYMSVSPSANGPWGSPRVVLPVNNFSNADSNLAAVIRANGSAVGLWRVRTFPPAAVGGSSRIHLLTAADWRDPDTYKVAREELFPEVGYRGAEDPHVYLDARGHFHAIFHHMDDADCPDVDELPACGAHAFSADGLVWTYGGVAFGRSVTFTDTGAAFDFVRRERPHMVFAKDGTTPVAVTNGVAFADQPAPAPYGTESATYTLLQPVSAPASVML